MALFLCSFVPGAARADSTSDALQRVAVSFSKLQSFRATMTSGTMTDKLEYVAPDRYHIIIHTTRDMEEMIVGDTVYAKLGEQWMKLPMPGVTQMVAHFREPAAAAANIQTSKVSDMGTTLLNGTPVHRYGVDSADGTHAVLWIGPHDLPLRVDVQGADKRVTTILYSDFNTPITIEAPV
jgi:hypothetical protein